MKATLRGIDLECTTGDIADQRDVAAVVNAANAQLAPGGGVAGAIHRAAGPGLAKECRPLAPIRPGQAVATSGHNLPNDFVIHCLGPVFGIDEPSGKLLSDCYRNALELADSQGIESVAFPSISTGIFGYPQREAAEVAWQTVLESLPRLRRVKLIRFVLYSPSDLKVHQSVLKELLRSHLP